MSENASVLPGPPAPKRYHPALVALHWLIVILIFATAYFVLAEGEGRRGFGFTVAGLPTKATAGAEPEEYRPLDSAEATEGYLVGQEVDVDTIRYQNLSQRIAAFSLPNFTNYFQ